MPPSLQCDRCKHARWPCIYPRGVPSACCHGCAHSKLRCTRFIDPAPIVVELYKQGYCNMRTPSPSPGLPTPPKTQTPRSDARAPPAPGTATPAATPTPAPALPRILLRAPRPTPVEVAGSSRSASSTEADSIEVEAAVAPRTPVLPRGSAEPSRHLPPLASLSRPPSPRRATSIPTISGPVTPERRPVHSPPSLPSLSQSVTPERRAARTPRPQPSHPATPGTGSRPRPQRPSLSVTTQFCSPLETPLADRPGKDTILLRPEDGRVPFLVPHAHDAADARLVRDLGLSPTYLWRASEPCVACCDEGSSTLFGNVYVPRRVWGVVRAPTCLRCTAADRACQWLLNTGGDLLSTRRLGLVVLDSPGVAGAGVFVKASDLEGWSHAALARALHRGEGDEFDAAWHAALPGLLGTHEQYGLGTPRCDTDAPPVCTSLVLAEDRRHRPALARVVKALRRHDAYDPLLVTDMLRRLPGPEEGADAGLLRAEGEWGAWSFAGGELTLYLRDTPFHAGWDTKELDKAGCAPHCVADGQLFLGEEPNYQMGKDTPFVLWPPRQMRLPVESIVTRLLNVSPKGRRRGG